MFDTFGLSKMTAALRLEAPQDLLDKIDNYAVLKDYGIDLLQGFPLSPRSTQL